MTHDEMMSLLANTLADAAGSSGCLPILDCFSPHPGEEVTVSIPMCDDTVDIVLEDLDFPHEWEELLENSGADTMGDLVDYLYHASCHLNERCRDEIDAALAQRFDGMRLGAGAVEQVVAEYGLERTKYVLAAAIQTRDGDGRISRTNREWADSIRTIKDMDRRGFDRSCYYADLQAHTCLLDGFVNQVRKFEKAKAQPAQDTPER